MATHPAPLTDPEPNEPEPELDLGEPIPLAADGPGRGSRVPFGRQSQRELTGLPVIVSKRFVDGTRNIYRWIGQFDEWIPDKGAVLAQFGGGRFKLECPEGGRQYWDIAERHRSIEARRPRPTAAPTAAPAALGAAPGDLPHFIGGMLRAQGQMQTTIARIEGQLVHLGAGLDAISGNIGHALQRIELATRTQQAAPVHHAPAPVPLAPPAPAADMLGQLQGIVALKKTLDDLGGLFGGGGGGGGGDLEAPSEWAWLSDALKMGVGKAMQAAGPPGAQPPQPPQPPTRPTHLPHAAPLAAVRPVSAPVAPVAPARAGPTLAGTTPELEAQFDEIAAALDYTAEQARYYAMSQGWTLPEAVAMGRQMIAEGDDDDADDDADAELDADPNPAAPE